MIPLGPLIVEEGLVSKGEIKTRKTVRAIIKNEHEEILMVYAKTFDDFTFPGGGVMPDESDHEALKRVV